MSRAQALAAGLAPREIDRRLARRRWLPLHPRVYLVAGHPLTDEVRVRAAALWSGDGAVVVGAAAVWWHGLAEGAPATVAIAVPRRCPAPRPGVTAQRRVLPPHDVVTLRGLAVPVRPLALLDAAVEAGAGGPALLHRALRSGALGNRGLRREGGLAQLCAVAGSSGATATAARLIADLCRGRSDDARRRGPRRTPPGMGAVSESLQLAVSIAPTLEAAAPGAARPHGRGELRNVAIVAHVDHGKTTLVDAMLRASGAFGERAEPVDRVLDSGDLEREKGITILAKHTAIDWHGMTVNVVDTPGHADFGGEVERGLAMVDGVLLLVDASEGPLPQTRFVLRKTLAAGLPVVLVVNKTDRADARIGEVVDESLELLLELADELDLDEDHTGQLLDLPVVYASGRAGRASRRRPADGALPDEPDLEALFDVLLDTVPPPPDDPDAPLQAHVTNLDASAFLGRIALCRVRAGTIRRGQQVAWCQADGSVTRVKVAELLRTEALTRVPADSASAGDLVAVAGIAEVTIGDTLADPERPVALPRISVDEPAISMTVGINTSPLVGRDPHPGTKLTARLVKGRLDTELVGNVSIRVLPTERPDAWEVQGRGELALAVLVETMRREGFELTVGKPEVVTKRIDGRLHEPFEQLSVDVPTEHLGPVTQLLAGRKGEMIQMVHGESRVRMDFRVPSRGLIGFRTEFLTITRGAGIASHVFDGYGPWVGELRTRQRGSLVADRDGPVTAYAVDQLADRGVLFIGPTTKVYGGMVVGEYTRGEDLEVNITKEKKLTNMRSSTGDELVKLTPPTVLNLEQALEFCATDECVEVTPESVRVRKVQLDAHARARARARARTAAG